jgi:DUF4097 and DUF4098 domain-containing protein YvlB
MTTFPLTGPVLVNVDCAAGQIDVVSADAQTAEVELTPLRDDEATREAIANAVVELRGDRELVVQVPRRGWSLLGREPKVRVAVRVPHGCGLSFRTASAQVTATGTFADVRGKSASGDVAVSTAADLQVDTASGDIRADEVGGEAAVKTASGDITLGHVAGAVRANLVSGDLRVATADGDASVNGVSGDVELGAVTRGTVEVRTVSGDVVVGIRPGSRVHVDATSVSGDLRSDVPLDEAPGGEDGPLVDVRGRTVSGDLRVRRAVLA